MGMEQDGAAGELWTLHWCRAISGVRQAIHDCHSLRMLLRDLLQSFHDAYAGAACVVSLAAAPTSADGLSARICCTAAAPRSSVRAVSTVRVPGRCAKARAISNPMPGGAL